MNTKINQEILNQIREAAHDKIEYILSELSFDLDILRWNGDSIRGPCILHGGNNETAFSYSLKFKTWRCYTAGCDHGKRTIFDLVQKILSKQKNKEISFYDAVYWLANKLDIKINESDSIIDDPNEKYINNSIKELKYKKHIKQAIIPNQNEDFKQFPVSLLKNITPSEYFLKQGFLEKTLKKFHVGYCDDYHKPMYLRSYSPVLNDNGTIVVGVTGRIIYEKCEFCPYFHEQGNGCPTDNTSIRKYSKWKHFGFNSGSVLYNIWNSFDYIKKSKSVLLTEGPKDIWWLDQNKVYNTSCIFGLNITECHINKLIKTGVLTIILGLNNDERGISAMDKIIPELNPYFRVVTIHHLLNGYKDFAEIPEDYMRAKIIPFINSFNYNL